MWHLVFIILAPAPPSDGPRTVSSICSTDASPSTKMPPAPTSVKASSNVPSDSLFLNHTEGLVVPAFLQGAALAP